MAQQQQRPRPALLIGSDKFSALWNCNDFNEVMGLRVWGGWAGRGEGWVNEWFCVEGEGMGGGGRV